MIIEFRYLCSMKILYRNKAESNKEQRDSFLKLSPIERIYSFLSLIHHLKDFPTENKRSNDNFIVEINF